MIGLFPSPPCRRPELALSALDQHGTYVLLEPLTQARYRLGEEEYFLLMQLDGRRLTSEICAAFQRRFGTAVSEAECDEFIALARSQNLLKAAAASAADEPDPERDLKGPPLPIVIQDFRPLAECFEWRLSDACWTTEGIRPLARAPYRIHNDGRASEDAAEILLASCLESQPTGSPIAVLELGAGSGLFARFFLDAFQRECARRQVDFYDRLRYFVSDFSPRTVEQWTKWGIFEAHGPRVAPGVCNALRPAEFRGPNGQRLSLPLRAVFANYLLDQLPSAVIRAGAQGTEQLCVRTRLSSDPAVVGQFTQCTPDELRDLASSPDPGDRTALLPLRAVLEFDLAFRPVGDAATPYLDQALSYTNADEPFVLSFGAIQCLEQCLRLLEPEGFVLVSDFGGATQDASGDVMFAGRGDTVQMGVNLFFLERYFSKVGWAVLKPEGDEGSVHVRLLCRAPAPSTQESLSRCARKTVEPVVLEARMLADAGRYDDALRRYRAALEQAPYDWALRGELAEFLILQLGDFRSGLEAAERALALNPYNSAGLWAVQGDCLAGMGRWDEATASYRKACGIDPDHVRAAAGLAECHLQGAAFSEALAAIADGLARDHGGLYRQRLLTVQQRVLAGISRRDIVAQEQLRKRNQAFSLGSGVRNSIFTETGS